MCILRVLAADDAGARLLDDADLAASPQVLTAVGVDVPALRKERAMAKAPAPYDEIVSAVREVRALDAAGTPPRQALAPIARLPNASVLPEPQLPEAPVAGRRRFAYALLTGQGSNQLSPALRAAALRAWEDELKSVAPTREMIDGPSQLASAYQAGGDEAGVARALALEPRPHGQVEIMLQLGQIESAAAVAEGMTIEGLLPAMRLDALRQQEFDRTLSSMSVGIAAQVFGDQIKNAEASGDRRLAGKLRAMQAEIEKDAAPLAPDLTPRALQAAAVQQIRVTRLSVLKQAKDVGRPQAARHLADSMLKKTAPNRVSANDWEQMDVLIPVASPTEAAAWLNSLDATIQRDLRHGHGWSSDASARLAILVEGWTKLGRMDRLEALITRIRPLTDAERRGAGRGPEESPALNTQLRAMLVAVGRPDEGFALFPGRPEERLDNDLRRGRGLMNLDAYFAEASENNRFGLELHCMSAAQRAKAYSLIPNCLGGRKSAEAAPRQRQVYAETALASARLAAANGDGAAARNLLSWALDTARGIETDDAGDVFPRAALLELAKAELRADGRLPSRPDLQTMIGRAP